jgi:cell division protein FtsB
MDADDPAAEMAHAAHRGAFAEPRRRPWLLIASALLFALLAGLLWAKWKETRVRATDLEAELKAVYAEAETLRTQTVRAQQRIHDLEQQLRAAVARSAPAPHPSPR